MSEERVDNLATYREQRSAYAAARQAEHDEHYPPPTPQEIGAWRGDYGSSLRRTSGGWALVFTRGAGLVTNKQPEWSDWQFRSILDEAARLDVKTFPLGYLGEIDRATRLRRIVRTGWNSAKKRATACGMRFDLTVGHVDNLLWKQGTACAVSGIQFSTDVARIDQYRAPFRPSLDRIDPAKGYESGNVRLVLTLVNLAMNDWGENPLIEVARAIAAKHLPAETRQ